VSPLRGARSRSLSASALIVLSVVVFVVVVAESPMMLYLGRSPRSSPFRLCDFADFGVSASPRSVSGVFRFGGESE